jgi:hypothetical protein
LEPVPGLSPNEFTVSVVACVGLCLVGACPLVVVSQSHGNIDKMSQTAILFNFLFRFFFHLLKT